MRSTWALSAVTLWVTGVWAPEAFPQDEDSAFAQYLAQQPMISVVDDLDSPSVHDAEQVLRVGGVLGLGSCSRSDSITPTLYPLRFDGDPSSACGTGPFSGYCRKSWQNCVATPFGIICHHDYLARLHQLQAVVRVAAHLAVPPGPATPTEAMLTLSRWASRSTANLSASHEQQELARRYPPELSPGEDDTEEAITQSGIIAAVLYHEFAHLEQTGCALGHHDPRYLEMRDFLQQTACRQLDRNEMRADMRGLDVEATAAKFFEGMTKQDSVARSVHLRAVVARLEYEAMILPDPDHAARLYAGEPKDSTERWSYYFEAGKAHPRAPATGHIPPELRPVAALWLLKSRGSFIYRMADEAFTFAERLRPFIFGQIWAGCKGKFPPEGVRDGMDYLMFGRSPLE